MKNKINYEIKFYILLLSAFSAFTSVVLASPNEEDQAVPCFEENHYKEDLARLCGGGRTETENRLYHERIATLINSIRGSIDTSIQRNANPPVLRVDDNGIVWEVENLDDYDNYPYDELNGEGENLERPLRFGDIVRPESFTEEAVDASRNSTVHEIEAIIDEDKEEEPESTAVCPTYDSPRQTRVCPSYSPQSSRQPNIRRAISRDSMRQRTPIARRGLQPRRLEF